MNEDPAHVIDAIGRRCPVPVIELARYLGEVEIGALVSVLSDDPAASLDIPEWCRMRGQDYVGERPAGDATEYLVRRAS